MRCPCCKREMDPTNEITVDLNTNTIIYRGQQRKLTKQTTDVMYAMVSAYPNTVPTEKLLNAVWGFNCTKYVGDGELKNPMNALGVLLSKARKACAGLGLRIDSTPNRGYRITV